MRSPFLTLALASAAVMTMTVAHAQSAGPAMVAQSAAGPVLTDPRGMTLYTYTRDMTGYSNCNGACAQSWPPFTATADASGNGGWSVIARDGGGRQWAYKGAAVYTFSKDAKPGDTAGEGADGGKWHIARP